MIRIDCFIKDGCDACKIAIKNITEAIDEANCDITLNIRKISEVATSIKKFPTTIIYKETLSHELKELARLEGSFPSEYIEDIIDKLEKKINYESSRTYWHS